MRKGTESSSVRFLIGAVLFAFIFWNAESLDGCDRGARAYVNGSAITDAEFAQAFRLAAARMEGRGRNLTPEQAEQLSSSVLEGLIAGEALLQEADRLGIRVSDDEVAREVLKIEAFQKDGQFDERTYLQLLKAQGTTRAQFEEQIRRSMVQEKLYTFAQAAGMIPLSQVKDAFLTQNTTYEASFIRIPVTAFYPDIPVSDAEIDALLKDSEAKVKARYDELFERKYNLPKRYTLRMILVRADVAGMSKEEVKAKADAIRAEAAAGADFATLAKKYSEDLTASNGGDLGQRTATMLDPVEVTNADKTAVGALSEVFETGRGFELLRVEAVEDAKVISFDDAKRDLAKGLVQEAKAPAAIQQMSQQLLAAWGTTPPDASLLQPKNLQIESTGSFTFAQPDVPSIGVSAALQEALRGASAGQTLMTPFEVNGSWFLVRVEKKDVPSDADFAMQSPRLRTQLSVPEQEAFFDAWRTALVAGAKVTLPPTASSQQTRR